jgi:hypothetical protein
VVAQPVTIKRITALHTQRIRRTIPDFRDFATMQRPSRRRFAAVRLRDRPRFAGRVQAETSKLAGLFRMECPVAQ